MNCYSWTHHRDVVPIEENLFQLCNASPFGRLLILGDILQHHVHIVVKSQQRPHNLLVVLHYYVDSGSDTFVHQLYEGIRNQTN